MDRDEILRRLNHLSDQALDGQRLGVLSGAVAVEVTERCVGVIGMMRDASYTDEDVEREVDDVAGLLAYV